MSEDITWSAIRSMRCIKGLEAHARSFLVDHLEDNEIWSLNVFHIGALHCKQETQVIEEAKCTLRSKSR